MMLKCAKNDLDLITVFKLQAIEMSGPFNLAHPVHRWVKIFMWKRCNLSQWSAELRDNLEIEGGGGFS